MTKLVDIFARVQNLIPRCVNRAAARYGTVVHAYAFCELGRCELLVLVCFLKPLKHLSDRHQTLKRAQVLTFLVFSKPHEQHLELLFSGTPVRLWDEYGPHWSAQCFKYRMASAPNDQMENDPFHTLGLALVRPPIRIRWPDMDRCILSVFLNALLEFLVCLLIAPIFTPIRTDHINNLRRIDLQLMTTGKNLLHNLGAFDLEDLAGI